MQEVELVMINSGDKCTMYTLRFASDNKTEFEKFLTKFRNNSTYYPDYEAILLYLKRILSNGALERYFRREGRMNDSVVALPILKSKIRLYGLRISDTILILGNGDVKKSRTYQEDDNLNGYVITLQKLEQILKQEVKNGSVKISEKEIDTDETFKL